MSIARNTLKQVLLDNQKDIEQYIIFSRRFDLDSFPLQVFACQKFRQKDAEKPTFCIEQSMTKKRDIAKKLRVIRKLNDRCGRVVMMLIPLWVTPPDKRQKAMMKLEVYRIAQNSTAAASEMLYLCHRKQEAMANEAGGPQRNHSFDGGR